MSDLHLMNALFQCPSFFLSIRTPLHVPLFHIPYRIFDDVETNFQSSVCMLSGGMLWVVHFTEYPSLLSRVVLMMLKFHVCSIHTWSYWSLFHVCILPLIYLINLSHICLFSPTLFSLHEWGVVWLYIILIFVIYLLLSLFFLITNFYQFNY